MTRTEYQPQPCGLKKKVEISGDETGWRMRFIDHQPDGCCPHVYHVGFMVWPAGEHGVMTATIGWRCIEHTANRHPLVGGADVPGWRRVRLLDADLVQRSKGTKGWEYVAHESGDA